MKTIDFDAGPDEVLEELADGSVRVRRSVVFLTEPGGRRVSTVASPAVGLAFTAVKHKEANVPDKSKPDAPKPAPKRSLKQRLAEFFAGPALKELLADMDVEEQVSAAKGLLADALDLDNAFERTWCARYDLDRGLRCAVTQRFFGKVDDANMLATAAEYATEVNAMAGQMPLPLTAAKGADLSGDSDQALTVLSCVADMQAAQKAGKVLSKRNMELVGAAFTALQALMDAAMPKGDMGEDDATGDKPAVDDKGKPKGKAGDATVDTEEATAADAVDNKDKAAKTDGASASGNSTVPDGGVEGMAMKHAEITRLLNEASKEADATKRQGLLDQAQKLVLDASAPAPAAPAPAADMDAVMKAMGAKLDELATGLKQLSDGTVAAFEVVMKAIPGLDVPGDALGTEAQVGQRAINGALTPDQVAKGEQPFNTPSHLGSPLVGSTTPTAAPLQADMGIATGMKGMQDELAQLRQRLAMVEGGRPATKATPATGQPAQGGAWGAGWLDD